MSGSRGCTTKLSNASATAKSPHSRVAKTYNEIGVNPYDLFAEAVEFWVEFLADVFGFEEGREARDAFGFASAEPFEFVAGRVSLENIGSVDLRMKLPDGVEAVRITGAPVSGEEVLIGG